MIRNLGFDQLHQLLRTVFLLHDEEKDCTLFIDLPDEDAVDTAAWKDRRRLGAEWYALLHEHVDVLPFTGINCCAYECVRSNNADLPKRVTVVDSCSRSRKEVPPQERMLDGVLAGSSIVLALTEFSATAPLKILARRLGFRGATLPGFSREMLPALGLDYEAVNERVLQLKTRMDKAEQADVVLSAEGKLFKSTYDLRYRGGHASGGIIRDPGSIGNLPSGEAYIVPYEGERPEDPSRTEGLLPVQFGEEVVVFQLRGNRATGVLTSGPQSVIQRQNIESEPVYGNIAELGIGVLGEWGLHGIGSTLLDEKLGLHIAFGRSEHFGGIVSPSSFHDPARVVHVDWVYVPSVQPRISASEVTFRYHDGRQETILRAGKLVV